MDLLSIHDFAVLHMKDPPGVRGDVCIVCHHQNGAPFRAELDEQKHDVRAGFAVEVTGRFVCQDQSRIGDKRPCDGDTLTFAAREFIRSMLGTLDQTNSLECFRGTFVRVVTVSSVEKRQLYVFKGSETW
jgi:hypothetical protein